MKNGDMAVKRKAKKSGQQKRGIDRAPMGVMQEERQPVQQADKQRLRQQGRESMHADYRTEACPESFVCAHCGREIHPEGAGSNHRNHEEKGDRNASCHGEMEPLAIVSREDGDWSILHRCTRCGKLNLNRTLADDNPVLLTSLAVRPLAFPPFPLSYLEKFLDGKV